MDDPNFFFEVCGPIILCILLSYFPKNETPSFIPLT